MRQITGGDFCMISVLWMPGYFRCLGRICAVLAEFAGIMAAACRLKK